MGLEFLSFKATELKADVDKRTIEGYASTFGNVDSYQDTVIPGAFAKSLAKKFEPFDPGRGRVKMLWQHNPSLPLGVPEVLKEDSQGLFFRSRVAPTSYGNDALILIKEHVVDRVSIGFNTVKSKWKENPGDEENPYVRALLELDLWELSPVTFAADDHTALEAIKRADRLRQDLKSGRVLSSKNVDRLTQAIDLLSEILSSSAPSEEEAKSFLAPPVLDNWKSLEEMLAELKTDAALINQKS